MQFKEVCFSAKRVKPQHPPLNLGSNNVARKTEHKHLGMILDEELNFMSHPRSNRTGQKGNGGDEVFV